MLEPATEPHGQEPLRAPENGSAPLILVGNANVGKSAVFGTLTGRYVEVSNYPGTTVEVARGTMAIGDTTRAVVDTPGVHSIVPLSADEAVTRDVLLASPGATVALIADAKNLRRGLLLALELAEAGVPFVVALNMSDEAARRGIHVDVDALERNLGVPVVATVASTGEGIRDLVAGLQRASPSPLTVDYGAAIEDAVAAVADRLPEAGISSRALAIMLLVSETGLPDAVHLTTADDGEISQARGALEARIGQPVVYAVNRARLERADDLVARVVRRDALGDGAAARWSRLTVHPLWGWPLLLIVMLATYLFVGFFGAGVLVDALESGLFGGLVNPAVTRVFETVLPFPIVASFLVGPYGLFTMALTYGLAIVLPIVSTFFLAFAILEDSGYMPRVGVMLDRAFRLMGLNGKAVLPMLLGLGCDTMATMTTRILDTRKERLQVTLLLALGVPCSAQLGVILGMAAGIGLAAASVWIGVVTAVMLTVGFLAGRLIPGERSDFVLELPPLRRPGARNVVVKTVARVEWYLREVIPVFIAGTAILFTLDLFGVLARLERWLAPVVVGWLGLPGEVTSSLLLGFLRRDYGAAGMYALSLEGALTTAQVLVSLVVITLFMPCFATLLVIVREHGARAAAAVAAFVFPFAVLVGGILNLALSALGWFQ